MSDQSLTGTSVQSSVPSSALKTTGSDFNEPTMEPVAVELTTDEALKLLGRMYKTIKGGVRRPEAVRFMMGAQELRIQHNTDIIVKANVKSNGTELWTILADHEIRRVFNPEYTWLSY